MIDAKNFLGITREIIEQQIRDRSTDAVCEIESVNEDGTLNVFVLPDKQTILKNIINESRYNFKRGDNALLYKIHNRLSDSFVVAKFRPKQEDAGISEKLVQNLIDNALQNYQGGSGGGVSGEIQGPTGPQGVQGEIGPTGAAGPTGPLNKEAFVDAKVFPTGTVVFTKDNGKTVALQFAQISGSSIANYNIRSYTIPANTGWTGESAPYTNTKTAADGGWTPTQDILVQMRLGDGSPYEGVHAKYTVTNTGTIVVSSDTKMTLQILVADGLMAGPQGPTGPKGDPGNASLLTYSVSESSWSTTDNVNYGSYKYSVSGIPDSSSAIVDVYDSDNCLVYANVKHNSGTVTVYSNTKISGKICIVR